LCALSDLIAGPELRAETLLAIARRAVPEEEGRICGTVVALLAGLPRDDRRADLLAQAVTACPQDRLPLAAAAAEEVVDPQAGSALRAAIGVRYCDLGDVRAARSLVSATDPPWRGPLLRGIALAIARSPSAAEAVDLADELPYVAWRAEVLVTAAHRLEEAAAGSAVARAVELAQQLTGSAQVAVLAHTALEGPAGFRDQVLDVARRAAGALTDSFDRSLAELAICTALARSGEPADAVTVASGIATEQVRADALVTVVEAAGKRGGGALAADVVAAVLAVPMEDAASRARLRAALLTATPAGAPAERLASSLDDALAALRSRPRAELLEVLPGILATAGRLGGAGTVPQVAGDLAAVIRWWP
jgi:hypothetical protein